MQSRPWSVASLGLLAALGAFGCGDGGPGTESGGDGSTAREAGPGTDAGPDATPDPVLPDAGPTFDARPRDDGGPGPDVPAFPTDAPPDLGLPDSAHLCPPPDAQAAEPPPPTLENAVPLPPIEMGGPAAVDQLIAANLDGDPAEVLELVLVRGGRVLAARPDGRVLWQSEGFGVRYLGDLTDLNGDGRIEVVARSVRDVRIFDALTGVLRWQVPALPLGPDRPELVGVQRLILGDVDADGLPDVQVSDGGCGSSDGSGDSAFFSFATVQPDPATGRWQNVAALPVIPSPSRCSRWQNQADFDGDGRAELVVPTRTGLLAIEPSTGTTRYCLEGVPELNTQSLNRVMNLDAPDAPNAPNGPPALPEIVAFTQQRTLAIEATDTPAAAPCAEGTRALRIRWERPLVAARGERVAFLHPAGAPRVAVSAWDEAAAAWTTTVVEGAAGAELARLPGLLLIGPAELDGVSETAELLAFADAARTPAGFGTLLALQWNEGEARFDELWRKADAAPLLRRHPAGEADRPIDFREPLALEARALVVRYDAQRLAAERLEAVAVDGAVSTFDLTGDPGAADVHCAAAGCRLALALTDGRVGVFDSRLVLQSPDEGGERPALLSPTGTTTLLSVPGPDTAALLAVSTTGVLGRIRPVSGPASWVWQVPLGSGDGSSRPVALAVPGTLGVVARRDFRSGPSVTWAFFDADTGDRLGQHALDGNLFGGLGEALALDVNGDHRDDLIRFDRALTAGAPDERCPARPVEDRIVTAVDGNTHDTLWQTPLRPADPCRSPFAERISVATLSGAPAIFVTESNSIRRLEPATGAEVDRADLDDLPSSLRGGGWLIATGLDTPALLRVGGNGPIEARDAALELVWRAADDLAIGNRSWRDRAAVVMGRQVWLSPAPNAPVLRLGLDGPQAGQVEGTIRLGGGFELAPDAPGQAELGAWLPASGLSAQVPSGVLVNGDDGYVYALAGDGALVFARAYGDAPGRPVVGDVDGDGVEELVAAVADGTVVISDNASLPGPLQAWDIPCPPDPQCLPEQDIDVTFERTRLCAEWVPTADAEGYFVRVVGPNGAPISDWQNAGDRPVARLDDLELVPGSLYCVEVRAWRQPGPQIEVSPPIATDCVLVLDQTPPTVALEVPDAQWFTGDAPLDIRLIAHDDEALAGWRIELWSALGLRVGVLWSGVAQGTDWTVDRTFGGRDALGKALPPGLFELRGYAQDQAGAEAMATTPLTLCAEPCP